MRLLRPSVLAASALLALAALCAPSAGRAEGLLDFLFGPDPAPQAPPAAPSAPARRAKAQKATGSLRFAKPREGGESWSGGFCVRTCDGYYFPLIKMSRATRQQSCDFACPSAPMEIYDGSTIEQARNSRGQRYSALPVAFAFRERATQKCMCNDPETSQGYFEKLARTDPTLKSGDIVVEDTGAFVYSGTSLVPLSNASFMSSQARDRLRALLRRSAPVKPSLSGSIESAPASQGVELSDADRAAARTR
jgi:hypothetical protein